MNGRDDDDDDEYRFQGVTKKIKAKKSAGTSN